MAEILIAAGADLNTKDTVRHSLARLSLLLKVCCWVDRVGGPLYTRQQYTVGLKWLKSWSLLELT